MRVCIGSLRLVVMQVWRKSGVGCEMGREKISDSIRVGWWVQAVARIVVVIEHEIGEGVSDSLHFDWWLQAVSKIGHEIGREKVSGLTRVDWWVQWVRRIGFVV